MNANEIKSITLLINEAKESAKLQRELITDDLTDRKVNISVLEDIVRDMCEEPDEDFELSDSVVREYYDAIHTGDEVLDDAGKREYVQYAIDSVKDIISTENDLAKLEQEANGEIKSYTDYICSEAYDQHRMKNIEMWKSMLEREENPVKARKLQKAIYIAENRFTLIFMFERLNNPATHDMEKVSMIESFFGSTKSNYALQRFAEKCKQFGFSKDLYRYLLDLEERYLDEKYHVFNNFFLFTAVRFIGHCGDDEINEAKEVVQCMLNLVYNRFYSEDVREIFLSTIRTFLDQFEDVREIFDEKNILHPNHPYRIQKEKEREANLRAKLYGEMVQKLGIKLEEMKKELDAMSMQELISYYDTKLKEQESKEKEEAGDEEESAEDNVKLDDKESESNGTDND